MKARNNIVESFKTFNDLPGDCITTIFSLSSPSDVCRAAATCSTLRLAAAEDFVWEKFLPLDYKDIVSRVDGPCLINKNGVGDGTCSMRDLFFLLCHSLLLDGGRKIIELEKCKGLISYTLSARELSIIWGDNPMYWSWKFTPDSRFAETAELIMTSWLEINGKIKTKKLSPNTNYGAYLLFKVSKRGFGLDTMPMETTIQVGNNPVCRSIVYLRQDDGQKQQLEWLIYYNRVEMLKSRVIKGSKGSDPVLPGIRYNGWMEIELGRFYIDYHHHYDDDHEIKMSLMEIKGYHLKGGLIVEGIEIRPII